MVLARARPANCVHSPCVDESRCAACRHCPPMGICPSRVIERIPETGLVQITTLDGCYGCLACVTTCAVEAIWSD